MKAQIILLFLGVVFLIGCSNTLSNKDIRELSENPILKEAVANKNAEFPSYDPAYPPPADAPQIFALSQDYPQDLKEETYPWQKIDFTTHPNAYIHAVLDYSLEGNIEVDFRGQDNPIRKWYHAPWLHMDQIGKGGKGREFIHGLTRERAAPSYEIHDNQDKEMENWAVGMYNPPGGYTLGQVWESPGKAPNPKKANFPEGTVCCKLLFTAGTVELVPFLEGTFQWQADIYPTNPKLCKGGRYKCERQITTVSLLQIDVAVKDARAPNDWVFGTFIYDGAAKGNSPWERMVPVGLSWGDDSENTTMIHERGSYVNPSLEESYLNPQLIRENPQSFPPNKAYMKFHGLGGRMNGPVDNPISSCISCHSQAAVGINNPAETMSMGAFGTSAKDFTPDQFDDYFSSVSAGARKREFRNVEYLTTDYSLQLAGGIRNYWTIRRTAIAIKKQGKGGQFNIETLTLSEIDGIENSLDQSPTVSRGGDD